MNREVLKAIQEEAALCGLFYEISNGGKHKILTVSKDNHKIRIPFSTSPRSADNQKDWIRQNIRRGARELC